MRRWLLVISLGALLLTAGCAADDAAKGKGKSAGKKENGQVDSDFVLRGGFR